MTDTNNRLDALRALETKVVAGDWNDLMETAALATVWDIVNFSSVYLTFHGSLDAAKALHEAVVPDLVIGIEQVPDGEWYIRVENLYGIYGFYAESDDPARAWLIAIIRALIAIEESK